MIAKLVTTVLAAACLAQCAHQSEQRYLTNQDSGKVISERYYVVDVLRIVEGRYLVTATPRGQTNR